MRGIPALMILALIVLSVLMITVGWANRNDVGYIPVIIGVIWGVFSLACIAGRAAPSSS
jgi:hypothetical protein